MINWLQNENGEGHFKSSFFRNDENTDEFIIYANSDNTDFKECAEKCAEAFNHLSDTVINEICNGLIGCAEENGEFELPSLGNPAEILNYCWFVALYVDMESIDGEIAYAVEGEGEWGENIGFVINNNRVVYVGTDYLSYMKHSYLRSREKRKKVQLYGRNLKKYVHQNWEEVPKCRSDKYYFCKIDDNPENDFAEIQYQLETDIPEELKRFYHNIGFGFLWFSLRTKKGIYRILSPEEILDLYFEPEEEGVSDEFITYRENAWEKLENNGLLAFCLFGEEDSLLYIGTADGGIYYLSPARKIANSLYEFLQRLDEKADYFMR